MSATASSASVNHRSPAAASATLAAALALLLAGVALPPQTVRADDAAVAQALANHVSQPALRDIPLGLAVFDVRTGRVIFAHKADEPLIPASNMKLPTTAAALLALGPDWQFRTLVGSLGDDLVVIGGGDPNLSGRFYGGDAVAPFKQWAATLKARGLLHVKGNLVVDDSLFERQTVHPQWPADQYQLWHTAPVAALTTNDSCIDILLRPGSDGTAARVTLSPPTAYFDLQGSISTRRGAGNNPRIDRPRDSHLLRLGGTIPTGEALQKYYRTVDDPGMFAGTVILETLRREGIRIDGRVVRRRLYGPDWTLPPGLQTHLVHHSSLMMSVNVCNTRSQNLYAECILKLLGALGGENGGIKRQGSWASGGQQVERLLKLAGLETRGCVFDDGGGLSRNNRLTPRFVGTLLVKMAQSPHANLWRQSLAELGDSEGTLRKWKNEELAGRVRAKTGYLNNARTLSGYIDTRSGRTLAFSILANPPYRDAAHAAVRNLQEQVLLELVKM